MFATQQPADVREEESAGCVVWIGVCFRVFVVNTMISRPMHCRVLEGDGVEDHQDDTQRPFGLIGTMRPKPMSASSDTETTE